MNIPQFAEKHPKAIIFSVAVLGIAGIVAALNLPISIFPDITFPRIVILAESGEEPAERIMITLTKPLEEAANAIPDVRNVRSVTARGATEISINFSWGSDIILAQQLLQAKISSIRNQLPQDATVRVERMNATFFPIIGYALTSDKLNLVELKDLALYTIRPVLSRIQGISQVRVVGGKTREFLVTVDPVRLAAYAMDIRQVTDAIQKSNIFSAVGLVDAHYRLYLTLVNNMYPSIEAIQRTVISTRGSTSILLRDVAVVMPSEKDEYIRVTSDGKEAVLINIIKQPNGNTVQIAEDVKAALDELKPQIPKGVMIGNFYDQSDIITDSFASVRDSIGFGVVLAVAILLLFLKNWRVTFVAAIIIPITVSLTVLLLYTMKESFNIMTLGGIAAVLGLIIDDTIVIVENVFRHFRKGCQTVQHSIQNSIKEIFPAIVGSSAATIVILIPFAFLSGVTGSFFKSLSLAMGLALVVSFFMSLVLAPLLASRFIPVEDFEKESRAAHSGRIISLYKKILTALLKRRYLVFPFIILLAGGGYILYTQLGSSFMPEMDEGAFILDYAAPPGTSLQETHRILLNVEKSIMEIPEVGSYSRRTGLQMGFFVTEPNTGDYLVKLKKDRTRSSDEITGELRSKIESTQPALRIEFGEAIQDLIGDLTSVPSPIEIKIFGDQRSLIESTATKVASLIDSVPGVVDVFNGITISGPAYIVSVDERAAGRAGLTVQDVKEEIENDIQGSVATDIQHGEKLIGIRVRLPETYRTNLDRLQSLRVFSPNGGTYLLGGLAQIRIDPGQSEIVRENLKQMVAVTARLSERDLGSTMKDIQSHLNKNLVVPQGITIRYGGAYQTQQEAFRGLLMVLGAASLLVFIVLIVEFESFFITIAVYIVTLLSLFGVFFALWITNVTFNISSFVGSILIVGAVAENSIFLIHYWRQQVREGKAVNEALVEAGAIRFRPIIMTALAAMLTLLPLALGLGAGTQMQQPLAIAVIGGFSISTFLILFILPMIIIVMNHGRFRKERENIDV
ncbi:MAG: efflux RND transporter permease subunit [Ignavibacteriae bacterium]|nr:efflux RND transporter permease subunit [Ignavibacteria bacterium]MBI3365583.1 efflux RND transporter permease subunit [Ignavibacteriota bacterium]